MFRHEHSNPLSREQVVDVRVPGGDLNKVVKILKRKLLQFGLYRELRQHGFHEKPGIKCR